MVIYISIDGYLSYHGLPPYQQPLRNLRLLGMMFPLPIMYMVRADSGLRRVEDLRGKRRDQSIPEQDHPHLDPVPVPLATHRTASQ